MIQKWTLAGGRADEGRLLLPSKRFKSIGQLKEDSSFTNPDRTVFLSTRCPCLGGRPFTCASNYVVVFPLSVGESNGLVVPVCGLRCCAGITTWCSVLISPHSYAPSLIGLLRLPPPHGAADGVAMCLSDSHATGIILEGIGYIASGGTRR